MHKARLNIAAAAAFIAASFVAVSAHAQEKTFYLLSHGGPSDAFWIDWNAGATKACEQLKVKCNISFSGGDMAAQKEAFNSAIAAKPDGIGTTSAQPGLWNAEVAAAGPTNNCGICAHVTHVARADEKRLFTFAQCTVLQRGDGAVGDRG